MNDDELWLSRVDGLFVGMLDEDEQERFYALCKRGLARETYEGVGGFMGLAKVRSTRAEGA